MADILAVCKLYKLKTQYSTFISIIIECLYSSQGIFGLSPSRSDGTAKGLRALFEDGSINLINECASNAFQLTLCRLLNCLKNILKQTRLGNERGE